MSEFTVAGKADADQVNVVEIGTVKEKPGILY